MARHRRRRTRRSHSASLILLWLALLLFPTGMLVFLLLHAAWALAVSIGALAVFVLVAWYQAHPERGGQVGRPDIGWPWRDRGPLDGL